MATVLNTISVIPKYHEFELDYNDFRAIGNFRALRIFASHELEGLIGGYDLKKNKPTHPDIPKYKNFDRLICLVSDTHDDIESLKMLINFCNRYQIKLMIHSGDLISHHLIGNISKSYNGRFIIAMGNHDRNKKAMFKEYFRYNNRKVLVCPYEAHIKVLDNGNVIATNNVSKDKNFIGTVNPHIYLRVTHGEDYNHLRNIINFHENYDILIYGHTHNDDYRLINLYKDDKRTKVILNPGSFSWNRVPNDNTDKIGFMILGINDLQLTDIMKVNLSV